MPALLAPLLGALTNWRVLVGLGVGVLALGAWLYVGSLNGSIEELSADNARLTEQRDRALEAARETEAEMARLAEQHRRAIAAIEADRKAAESRAARLAATRKEIVDAPESEDGPVAPVLRRALDAVADRVRQ